MIFLVDEAISEQSPNLSQIRLAGNKGQFKLNCNSIQQQETLVIRENLFFIFIHLCNIWEL